MGKDGTTIGAKLRARQSYIEREIQHLYPIKLSCDRSKELLETVLSANALEFKPRREAAIIAKQAHSKHRQ